VNRFWFVFLCCISSVSVAQDGCLLPASLCKLQIEFESADKELNSVYKSIINSIKSGELSDSSLVAPDQLKQSLIVSQRSWLKFKEKNCDAFYILHSGGTGRNAARLECEISMTKSRTQYLENSY